MFDALPAGHRRAHQDALGATLLAQRYGSPRSLTVSEVSRAMDEVKGFVPYDGRPEQLLEIFTQAGGECGSKGGCEGKARDPVGVRWESRLEEGYFGQEFGEIRAGSSGSVARARRSRMPREMGAERGLYAGASGGRSGAPARSFRQHGASGEGPPGDDEIDPPEVPEPDPWDGTWDPWDGSSDDPWDKDVMPGDYGSFPPEDTSVGGEREPSEPDYPECDADVQPEGYGDWGQYSFAESLTNANRCLLNEAFRQINRNIDLVDNFFSKPEVQDDADPPGQYGATGFAVRRLLDGTDALVIRRSWVIGGGGGAFLLIWLDRDYLDFMSDKYLSSTLGGNDGEAACVVAEMAGKVIHETTHLALGLDSVQEWVPELASWYYRYMLKLRHGFTHPNCCATTPTCTSPDTWDPDTYRSACSRQNLSADLSGKLVQGGCSAPTCNPCD